MLIPSILACGYTASTSLSRRVNANSQQEQWMGMELYKLIKKGEC